MKFKSWCSPGQLVAAMLAGWTNRHQQAVVAYQKEEIKVRARCLVASVCDSLMNNVAGSH